MQSQPMGILPVNNATKHSNIKSFREQNVLTSPEVTYSVVDILLFVNLF